MYFIGTSCSGWSLMRRTGSDQIDRSSTAGLGLPAVQRRYERARPAAVAVLAQIDALPGPESEPAIADRERERGPQERRLDVRRHVVRPLVGVRPVRRLRWHRRVEP